MITIDSRITNGEHPLAQNEHAGIRRYRSADGAPALACQAMDFGTFIWHDGERSSMAPTDYVVSDPDGDDIRLVPVDEFESSYAPA